MSRHSDTGKGPDKQKVPVLIAYNNLMSASGDRTLRRLTSDSNLDILLDSGAFAAHNTGKVITVEQYCEFIQKHKDSLFAYFALDVIGEPVKSLANLHYMRNRQELSPWPIFTTGGSFEDYKRLADGADVVGIGGIQNQVWKGTRIQRVAYIHRCMQWAEKCGVKTHLLGVADPKIIATFRPYSCDTSKWLGSGRFGKMDVYMGNGRWEHISTGTRGESLTRDVRLEIERAGYAWTDVLKDELWNNQNETVLSGKSVLVHLTCRSWIKYVLEVEIRFGTKVFMVIGGSPEMDGRYPITEQAERILGPSTRDKAFDRDWEEEPAKKGLNKQSRKPKPFGGKGKRHRRKWELDATGGMQAGQNRKRRISREEL